MREEKRDEGMRDGQRSGKKEKSNVFFFLFSCPPSFLSLLSFFFSYTQTDNALFLVVLLKKCTM